MYRIGIDLGGTSVKAGIVGEDNQIIAHSAIPTGLGRGQGEIISDMCRQITDLLDKTALERQSCSGIGIGSPGVIDREKGVVLYSNNFSWEGVPLAGIMAEQLRLPVQVANDAQCAALGEARAGAGRGCQDLILITLGTGVGTGFIVGGRIFEGGHCGGGVAGHMVIVREGEKCTCGRRGCLEMYASATALIRQTREAVKKYPDSLLAAQCGGNPCRVDGETVFAAAKAGDPHAKGIITRYLAYLGDGIANLVDIFRPQKILLGGGICQQEGIFAPLNQYLKTACFAGEKLFIAPVERAMLGNQAGIVGAACLIEAR